MRLYFLSAIICAISAAGSLHAQWRSPRLSYLGPEEGLHAQIYDMVQDSTGYLYFATNVGLYRYDGHVFDFFGYDPKQPSSIGCGDVYRMTATSEGLIWMTLRYGGLNSFNPKTGEFNQYPLPELPFRSIPSGHAIYEENNKVLWIGATHFRLLAFDRDKKTFTTYAPDWIDPVKNGGRLVIRSIHQDKKDPDLLWLSVLGYREENAPDNANGIVSFQKSTGKFQVHPSFGEMRYMDEDGILWGTMWGNAITKFNPADDRCDTFNYAHVLDGDYERNYSVDIEPYRGKLLVATSKTLLSFDAHSKTFEVLKSVSDQSVNYVSLNTDRDDNLWIGTNQGAYIFNQDAQLIRFFSLDQFGTTLRIFPGRLTYDDRENVIYLANAGNQNPKRIYKIPLDEKMEKMASFIPTDFLVNGLAVNKNRLWIGSEQGFQWLDPATQIIHKTSLFPDEAEPLPWLWNMKSNQNGWIGALGMEEFLWFHPDWQQVHRIKMNAFPGSEYAKSFDNDFDGFSFGKNDKAYLFSNEIFDLDLLSGKIRALKYDQSANPNYLHIFFVGEDHEGSIWVSTVEFVGRYQLNGDSLMLKDRFTLSDGMISPIASELHFDKSGRVWAFTNNGMNCIDPVTRTVRFFGTKEGLPHPVVDPRQIISISDGRIATVNSNGLIIFNPDSLWKSTGPTNVPVVIKQIRIDGNQVEAHKSVDNISELNLKPGQNLVDIEFQALAYPDDYRMEYSYRISELQKDWISIGHNRFITLPSLSPGQYTFEVKAGRPNSTAPVKKLAIYIATPLYKRGWFLISMTLAFVGLTYTLIHRRIRKIREQENARTEINKRIAELELKALRSQMNPHFMFNSLNSIKNYILQAEPRLAAEYLSNFSHLIRMILQNSREKSISLQDELETLTLYIELERLRFDAAFDFNCIVDDGLDLYKIRIPPMLLQPYVENAIWHGLMHKKEKGVLMIMFRKEDDMINCTIEDNGVGRSAAHKMKSLSAVKYKSMGMGITQDRIEIMNKMDAIGITTEVVDKMDSDGNPSGTRIILRIPYLNGMML